MMRAFLYNACRLVAALILAAAAVAGCRLALWAAGWPASWTLPGAAAIWLAVYGVGPLRQFLADRREALRLARAETAPADPAAAARMRLTWRKAAAVLGKSEPGLFSRRPPRPWYICLGQDGQQRKRLLGLASPPGREPPAGEFDWHFSPGAVWLDLDFAWDEDPGNRWPLFLEQLRRRGADRLAGVVLTLDAAFLVRDDESELRAAAGLLRQRLDRLRESVGAVPPVYLLVNRIDRLYGLRTLAGALEPDRLAAPLGDFRLAAGEATTRFVRRVIARAAAALAAGAASAAAFQAPAELERLAAPLAFFCREALGDGPRDDAPTLRGLFLGSTGPKGSPLPPLIAGLPGVVPVAEPPVPARAWFWTELVRELLPRDARPARPAPGRGFALALGSRAGLAGLLCGTLVLCWLLTWSFVESRHLLLAAAGKIEPPESAEHLEPLLELASFAQDRNRGWWLPRFGMREAEALEEEIKQRFVAGYFDLRTIPHIENIQDIALTAADSDNPYLIGKVLLRLMLTRDGISRCLGAGGDGGTGRFLRSMAELLNVATPEETRRWEKYRAWAGPQDWMPATRDALVEFERYILDKAAGGDLNWLISWARGLPGMRPVDASPLWAPLLPAGAERERLVVDPAWTADAYRLVRAFLDAVVYDSRDPGTWLKRRDAFLAEYRREARERWRRAAEELWIGHRDAIPDDLLTPLLRQAMRGEDPATAFSALLRRHLLPMFEGEAPDPDIAWLVGHQGLFFPEPGPERPAGGEAPLTVFVRRVVGAAKEAGSDEALDRWSRKYLAADAGGKERAAVAERQRFTAAVRRICALGESPEINLAAVRNQYRRRGAGLSSLPVSPNDPFAEAAESAEALHRHLLESAGGVWNSLSPLAVYNYVRHLAVRQAALSLDAAWRETVYNPFHTLPGDRADRRAVLGGLLDKFLNGPAQGFWKLEEGGKLAAAAWERTPFPFDAGFLPFCEQALADARRPDTGRISLPFRIDAVSVDADARERPLYVEFAVSGGGETERVVYRNFAAAGVFTWRGGVRQVVDVDIVFSAFRLHRRFAGEQALADLVRAFASGVWSVERAAFPDHAAALAAVGVGRVVVRGSFGNGEELIREAERKPLSLPSAIVESGGRAEAPPSAPGMVAHAAGVAADW